MNLLLELFRRKPGGIPSTSLQIFAFGLTLVTGFAAEEKKTTETPPVEPTEISLEDLTRMEIPTVEAASKYKQKITEAPSSVTIVTADDVKKHGHRTLADVLQSVPGMYVTYDRNYSFLGVRGFNRGDYNSRVLLLVDGHRVNNSLSDGAFIGTEFILDVDLIDRVEIIRGPGSSLYGNNAFFGVINVITRRGRDVTGLGGEVSGEYASFDTYKGRATYGTKFKNGLELLLSGTVYDSAGPKRLFYKEFDFPLLKPPVSGVAENLDDDAFKSLFGTLSFHDFSLQGAFITREKGNPTAPNGTVFNDRRSRTIDKRGYVNFKYAHEFPDILDVTAQVYYDRQDFRGGYPTTNIALTNVTLFEDIQVGEWVGTELQLTKRLWERHTLTFGGEYRNDFRQEDRILDAGTGAVLSDTRRTRQSYGIYFQGDFAVLTNLHFNAGVRFDQYGDFDPAFNPRLALIYNPVGQTVFKAIYGTAFRAPNFFELRRNPVPGAPPPPEPETITTYELVYEQGIGDHLRSSVAGFYNQIEDLIMFQGGFYQNLNNAEAKGVELALDGFWADVIRGRVSYTLQETKDRSTGRVLSDSPRHLGKINLSVPLWKEKIFAGAEFLYVSPRNTEVGTVAGGHGIVNLTLFSQNLFKGLEISGGVYNLLDRHYYDPATPFHTQDVIEQNGRMFRVKLTYRF